MMLMFEGINSNTRGVQEGINSNTRGVLTVLQRSTRGGICSIPVYYNSHCNILIMFEYTAI